MTCFALVCAAALAAAPLDQEIAAVAALPGEPHAVSAAGLTADESPVLTLENASAFDSGTTRRRVVLVGADDLAAAHAVVAAVRWLKTQAPRVVRDRWIASALPQPRFRPDDLQSLTRWLSFQ